MRWIPAIENGSGPKYRAICDAIAADISSGILARSQKLPPHRELAYHLGVTTGTVSRAYAEAAERGLVVGEVGRGTFVNDFGPGKDESTRLVVAESGQTDYLDLGLNLSAVEISDRMLRETLREIANSKNISNYLNYQSALGMLSQRSVMTQCLRRLNFDAHPDQIVLCNGGQHGILLSAMALLNQGDTMVTEDLTYPGVLAVAHQLGIQLAGAAMDGQGIIPEILEEICEQKKPKALYCMPVLQNPTTVTMSQERVNEIAKIADKYGLWIIEDDVYGFLSKDRPTPLATLLPERTVYVSSASKSMAPGLRAGFLVTPQGLRESFQQVATLCNWMSSPLTTEIFVRWMANGHADKLIGWHREQAEERQKIARSVLGSHVLNISDAGYHLWLKLPDRWRMDTFSRSALEHGVRVLTADAFSVRRENSPHAIRLCLGPAHNSGEIKKAVNVLGRILETNPRPVMGLDLVHTQHLF